MKGASFFRCLGNETRLAALKHLARKGEACVTDLAEAVGSEQTNLSHHLAQMRSCGLVASRHEGKRVLYRLATPKLGALLEEADALAEHLACEDEEACA